MAKKDPSYDASSREPLGNIAYDKLREGIRLGELKPGQRIREVGIADWLAMSRTPVREALRRLEAEGLIAHEQRRGVVIAQLDHQMVMELYATRESLEGTAARLTARHASDAEIALLQQMLAEEAELHDNPHALRDHNDVFHRELFSSAHNRYLLQAAGALHNTMLLLKNTTFILKDRPQSALKEHKAIVQAITQRDPDKADAAARFHIQSSLKCRLRMMAEERKGGVSEAA